MSKPLRPKYQTTNWPTYNQSLKRRGQLLVWLDKGMNWFAPATGRRGRQPTFSDAVIQFCLTIKCLFGLALRQTIGMVESLLRLAGLDWTVPDFSTLSRRQKDLQVRIPLQKRQGCLHLLVDSTGIKMSGEGEWKVKKVWSKQRCTASSCWRTGLCLVTLTGRWPSFKSARRY